MPNTKARSQYLQSIAAEIVAAAGIDVSVQVPADVRRRLMGQMVERAACHPDTAKRKIMRAIRLARGELVAQWGGAREGAGRPRKEHTAN